MQSFQKDFIELALSIRALGFGEFTLKSGRLSPYFFNAGLFNTGRALAKLGKCYADNIVANDINFDVIFGPAYKGISLAAATAIALAEHHNIDAAFAFNRKEAKDHGEGGTIVGAPLTGNVLVIDDVITAGTAFREAKAMIELHGASVSAVALAVDRQERGQGTMSAIQEVQSEHGIPVTSIITLDILMEYIQDNAELATYLPKIKAYREQYGVN